MHNDLSGEASNVVQAGTVTGGVHFHGTAGPGRPGTARPIGLWDPFDLDVHRAITVATTGLPALPAYLRRGHDDELDAHLATLDRTTMVVLTGESSTGKTRALYEAVRRHEVLRDWPLVYPRTADDLVSTAGRLRAGTVLWLNETQHHLSGVQAVSTLRALLERPGPVVVLGTLWPQFWSEFTAGHEHARSLLVHRVVRIRVADRFDGRDVATLMADERADPRLVTAVTTSGPSRRVIQTIAGGPALVERYRHPDSADDRYATAILSAALDARRLGYQGLLTGALLADAAEGYLAAEDQVDVPEDWFGRGLDRAARGDSHGITALIPKRVSPGPGPAEGYDLHDYVDQQGRAARRSTPAPASLWQALVDHAEEHDDRARLATSAYDRLLYRYADPLREGVDLADPHWSRLLAMLVRHGRTEAVLLVLGRSRGPHGPWERLLDTVEEIGAEGRTTEYRALLEALVRREQRPARVGPLLVEHLVDLDLLDEALDVGRRAPESCAALATALADRGRWDEALAIVREGSVTWVPRWLADRLAAAGNITGLRRLAATNCVEAVAHLVADDLRHGRLDDALEGLTALRRSRHRLDADLVTLLIERGQVETVVQFVEDQHPLELKALVDGLVSLGQEERALRLLTVHDTDRNLLADFLVARSRWEEAVALVGTVPAWAYWWIPQRLAEVGNTAKLREAAERGNPHAQLLLTDLLPPDEAVDVLRRFAAQDDLVAIELADVLAGRRRFAELRERTAAGDRYSGEWLVRLAHRGGLPDGERLVRFGLTPDGTVAEA